MAHRRGFTLIELLVVIAIIGMLSSVLLASLNTARGKARDAQRAASIQQLRVALELYYSDYGQYPASGGATSPNGGWSTSNDTSWTTLQTALAPYMKTIPHDPQESSSNWAGVTGVYAYSYYSLGYGCDRQWYMIVWRAEGTVASPGITACDGTTFNYGSGAITVGNR
jgi:type II secretion system protein G